MKIHWLKFDLIIFHFFLYFWGNSFLDFWPGRGEAWFRKTGQWTEGKMWSNRETCTGTENGGREKTHRGNAVLEENKPAAEGMTVRLHYTLKHNNW